MDLDARAFVLELQSVLAERHTEADAAKQQGAARAWSAFIFPRLVELAERKNLWWASRSLLDGSTRLPTHRLTGEPRESLWEFTLYANEGPGSGAWGMPLAIIEHDNVWNREAFRFDHWKTLLGYAPLRVAFGYASKIEERDDWVQAINAAAKDEGWRFPPGVEDLLVLGFGGMNLSDYAFFLRSGKRTSWRPFHPDRTAPGDVESSSVADAAELLTDKRLRRLLDDVVATHAPLAVYLFGSRAEGRATETSDYDLLVVLEDGATDAQLDLDRAFASGIRTRIPADVIVTTREWFVACRGNLSTIEGQAQARGVLLFGGLDLGDAETRG